jgi:hypothetical protein
VIVEFRNYTLQPGRRDELVALFEREFLETQEAAGMTLIGHFTVLGDANRFVWLRGFADMQTRAASLAAFYDGPVWAKHRNAANATIVDSDNVLLLRAARPSSGFGTSPGEPFPVGSEQPSGRIYASVVSYLSEPADDGPVARLEQSVTPIVSAAGGNVLASYLTEQSANDYPRLPVREGVNAVVWFGVFPGAATIEGCLASPALRFSDRTETMRLVPTPRSRLR